MGGNETSNNDVILLEAKSGHTPVSSPDNNWLEEKSHQESIRQIIDDEEVPRIMHYTIDCDAVQGET